MPSLSTQNYHIGIICALDSELAAVEAMLDEEHEPTFTRDKHDHNTYSVGRIHAHNVVIACLPAGVDGLTAAATVAKDMSRSFSQLRFGLLVGIGGGIPDLERGVDIRLGDIVVSQPTGTTGGVVQYDKRKSKVGGEWERKGTLNAPPTSLLTALQSLKARHRRRDSMVSGLIATMLQRYPKMARSGYAFPGRDQDILKRPVQNHEDAEVAINAPINYDVVLRPPRETDDPEIHYGVIASGNQVVKDAVVRDRLRQDCNALCVEMEAAGLMNEFPCLVIRGICDYADAHKNDQWHQYAAASAAAYAKELLLFVSLDQTNYEMSVQQILGPLDKHWQQLHTHHDRHEGYLQRQETRYQDDKQRECHQAFKTSNYEEHKNRNPERVPETCRWLLDHAKYLRWYENRQSDLLWVSADPGCGKSVLSKSLIDQDLDSGAMDRDTIICYFFFKDNGQQDSLCTALCAVLHQLFDRRPQLVSHALPAWNKSGHKLMSDADEMWRVLLAATADQETCHVVCVLDALDECREVDRQRLISKLCQYYNDKDQGLSAASKLKFLVTSRPYNDIEHHFGGIATSLPSIRLRGEDENDQLRKEIDLVVQQRVRHLAVEFHLASTTVETLERRLLAMEHRTYLWLYLAIDNIRETFLHSLRPDQESIELLPDSVDEAYEQILSKIGHKQTKQVKTILRIILGAHRPLTVGEMALALGIVTSKTTLQSISDLTVREDQLTSHIRHWCGLFVFINHSQLYLIHQTAKEFLVRDSERLWVDSGKWRHCISATDAELTMAEVCIVYLCLKDFETPEVETEDESLNSNTATSVENYHAGSAYMQQQLGDDERLFRLAATSWAHLWRNIEFMADTSLTEKVWTLYDRNSHRFTRWTKAAWNSRSFLMDPVKMTSLDVAAYNGHLGVVHRMLNAGLRNSNFNDLEGGTALTRAASQEHSDTFAILPQARADVHTQDDRYYNDALDAASFEGHEKVVQMLLEAGADVNARASEHGGNALCVASFRGHEKVVEMLLDAGADVTAQDDIHGSDALYAASSQGHEKVVEMLLEAGADVYTQDDRYYNNALDAASFEGHEKVVQMLLEAGADVNARASEHGGNALYVASFRGHEKVVEMLLDAGADAIAQDDIYGSNALYAASSQGHEKVVEMLLEAGADVYTQDDRYYKDAFCVASSQGHEKVVEMLLEAGATVNAQGELDQSALDGGVFHDRATLKLLTRVVRHIGNTVTRGSSYYL